MRDTCARAEGYCGSVLRSFSGYWLSLYNSPFLKRFRLEREFFPFFDFIIHEKSSKVNTLLWILYLCTKALPANCIENTNASQRWNDPLSARLFLACYGFYYQFLDFKIWNLYELLCILRKVFITLFSPQPK